MGLFRDWVGWAARSAFPLVVSTTGQAVATKAYNFFELADLDGMAELMGTETAAGNRVSAKSALQVTTALACVRAIAEGLAQVPLQLMRRRADGKGFDLAVDHSLFDIINGQPNEWQTWFEFVETLTSHAALTGGGFAFKAWTTRGKLSELIPLQPGTVTIRQKPGYEVEYTVNDSLGCMGVFTSKEIFHLRGPSWDGVNGWDIARLARNAIGLAAATEESQAKVHANGGRVAGILSTASPLAADVIERVRTAWVQHYGGSKNAGKTAILDNGFKYEAMAQSHVEMQTLEARKLQIEEVCRAFMVFPAVIGHADKASTYASVEQFFLAHVRHSLQPWVRRWEDKFKVALLTGSPDDRGICFRFDMSQLMRGDSTSRANFYNKGITGGWLTRNEARAFENMNPIDGLDEPLIPLNMVNPNDQPDAGTDPAAGDTGAAKELTE